MQNLLMVLQAELGEVDWIRFGMERSSHVQQAVPNWGKVEPTAQVHGMEWPADLNDLQCSSAPV